MRRDSHNSWVQAGNDQLTQFICSPQKQEWEVHRRWRDSHDNCIRTSKVQLEVQSIKCLKHQRSVLHYRIESNQEASASEETVITTAFERATRRKKCRKANVWNIGCQYFVSTWNSIKELCSANKIIHRSQLLPSQKLYSVRVAKQRECKLKEISFLTSRAQLQIKA